MASRRVPPGGAGVAPASLVAERICACLAMVGVWLHADHGSKRGHAGRRLTSR